MAGKISKADKLLGLDNPAQQETRMMVQKAGWVQRQAGRAAAFASPWKKKFAVVKDGFLLFYGAPPGDADSFPLDVKPSAVVPLGGATVSLDLKDKTQISLSHPDVPGAAFRLRVEDAGEAAMWLLALEGGKKATWENALLGDAVVDRMRAAGTAKEEDKSRAVRDMAELAQRLRSEREQAGKVTAKDLQRREAFNAKLAAEQQRAEQLELERATLQRTIKREAEQTKHAEAKRQGVEQMVRRAELALKSLEDAMLLSLGEGKAPRKSQRAGAAPPPALSKEDRDLKDSVAALRAFFDARATEHQRVQASMPNIKAR
jgi:hypothetical protein